MYFKLNVALFEPQIPANTGNIIRLCANTGAALHLIQPYGFVWDDKRLTRAALDYSEFAQVQHHHDWAAFKAAMQAQDARIIAFTTKGDQPYTTYAYQSGDCLLFGAETHGLTPEIHADTALNARVILPMQATSRSLNLSNTVAVGVYEAWRQLDFAPLSSSCSIGCAKSLANSLSMGR